MVCTTCFGNARGCTGNAATCPWVKDVDENRLALERGNSTAVKTASVLPDYISRLFPPSAIKALVGLSSRPICEVPFDFASNPTMLELVSGVIQNRPPKDDALQYIQRLIGELDPDDSTSPFKLSQYSATIENIRAITPKTVSGTTRTEGARCYILYRCSMGLCGKDLRLESSFEFCDVNDDDTDVNFMDNYFNQVIIDYNKESEELKVSFMDTNLMGGNQQIKVNDPIIKMQLKLTDFISMDNGSAFLGFTHETSNLHNRLFLKNWSFTSSYQSNK